MADRLDVTRSNTKAGELMTVRYVGAGGSDANDGLSWANRKLTLNGVEDTPIQAGDTVYVAPGVYREKLTCDVDGTSGAGVITYIGDYDGSHTDGVGGIVRISGSDNDTSATRTHGISCIKDYRTFKGFTFDYVTYAIQVGSGAAANIIIEKCYFQPGNKTGVEVTTATTAVTIRNCYFDGCLTGINITHSSTVDSSAIAVENCIFTNSTTSVSLTRYGGVTVRNCLFWGGTGLGRGVYMPTSPAAGQTCTVNNCLFWGGYRAMEASAADFLVEDYNNIIAANAARVNVAVGAHSTAYPIMADPRWFFEMVNGGTMLTPFDLASYSQLIDMAGTSPTTADLRGTTKQGTEREWGALEYDSTLDIEAGSGGGGAVRILPFGGIGL